MNTKKIKSIMNSVQDILDRVHKDEHEQALVISQVNEVYRQSAANLINYLSLRSFDLRDLQRKLGKLGMSRLARAEAHVKASLKMTLFYLRLLLGENVERPADITVSFKKSDKILAKRTRSILGKEPLKRRLRIMVTIPSKAADNYSLVEGMVSAGMDCARINCAHDGPETWLKMIENIKVAGSRCDKRVIVAMDIGGPKIRTGEMVVQNGKEISISLGKNDNIILDKQSIKGQPAQYDAEGNLIREARISCTLPQALDTANAGESVFFDDGEIKGIIAEKYPGHLRVRIIDVKEGGSRLKADKGINFPDSRLDIRGLTEKDKEELKFIAQHGDIVNFSFVNSPEDVTDILYELERLGVKDKLGIILKIETRKSYDNLPSILLEGMKSAKIGVMIARGDLAIEVGWKRMGNIQKEILAICNACHVPVIWATQVLENLARKGLPSRSEITDAVNATKADCVMLNKGPHILQAILLLNEILESSEGFQYKNAPMLPKLERISKR